MEEIKSTPGSQWVPLGTVLLALLVTSLGVSAVTGGTETIAAALKADTAAAEWIFKAYVLSFAVFLLVGGKLGDLFGRRKALLAGLGVFAASSVAAGAVSDAGWLVAARAVQGAGAALILPATLALVLETFPHRRRGTAFGLWTAVLAVAFAGGIALSGWIVDGLGWRWLFYGSGALSVLAILFAFRFVPAARHAAGRFDLATALTATGGLAALGVALFEGQGTGWGSPLVVALLVLSATQLLSFVLIERRQPDPLVNLARFRDPAFGIGSLVMFLASAGIFGSFFLAALQLQQVLGYSAPDTAAALAPLAAVVLVVAPLAGKLAHRFDRRWLIAAGLLLVTGALWGLSLVDATGTRTDLAVPLAILGLGLALALPAVTAAALDDALPNEYGTAAGVFGAARNMGAVAGVAVATSVFVAQVGSQVPKALADDKEVPEGLSEQFKVVIEQNGIDLLRIDETGAGLMGARTGPGSGLRSFPRESEPVPVLGTIAQAPPGQSGPPGSGPGGSPRTLTPKQQAAQQRQIERQQRELRRQAERQQARTESAVDEGLANAAGRAYQMLSIFTLLGALATIYLGGPQRRRGETEHPDQQRVG